MNRPELTQALESIEKQTYTNLEIILVDASGKGLTAHKPLTLRTPIKEIKNNTQLNRPAAANKALANANGAYCLFLDEDDWIAPEHIKNLVEALNKASSVGVAYSNTQRTQLDGTLLDEIFDTPFDEPKLRRDNFIPIHSALFRRELYTSGCLFDESLEIFEDWDFWLQIAQRTQFLHINATTAFYRDGGDSNTATKKPWIRFQAGNPISAGRALLFKKWFPLWKGQEINETLGSLESTEKILDLESQVHELHQELSSANKDRERLNHSLTSINDSLAELDKRLNNEIKVLSLKQNKLEQSLQRKNAEVQEAKAHIENLNAYIHQLHNSLSWKLTKPVRGTKQLLIRMGAQKIKAKLASIKKTRLSKTVEKSTGIHCSLDSPTRAQYEFSEQITLQGFGCSLTGIAQIEAVVDGQVLSTFKTGISRQDLVAAFPEIKDASSAGFYNELDLKDFAPGEHTLELRFTDNSGETCSIHRTFNLLQKKDLYNSWYWRNTPDKSEIVKSLPHIDAAAKSVCFHAIVTGSDHDGLIVTLASLGDQSWRHLHVHLVDIDEKTFSELSLSDAEKNWASLEYHKDTSNALLQIANPSHWLVLMEAGEVLSPNALVEFSQIAKHDESMLIYSDHDQYDSDNNHSNGIFTPTWSPEHLYANNYIGQVFAVRKQVLANVSLPTANQSQWRYRLLLSLSELVEQPRRVAKVLWSRPLEDHNSLNSIAELGAIEDWLKSEAPKASVVANENGIRHIQWPLERKPKVSIIIPTMGKLDLIEPCIESLLTKTDYPNFEIIILDNGRGAFPEGIAYLRKKGLKVVECNYAFNWAKLNNVGTQHSSGELFLFLNDDIEIIHESWLEEMVRVAMRPQTGTVGALLYYPNGALQHAGVLLINFGGGALHMFHKRMPNKNMYRCLHETTREVSANTGACLMVSKEKFDKIGGFDEELAVVGNDIDLCIRLMNIGYNNVWTPHAKLIHHESISRKTNTPTEDEKAMWSRWGKLFLAGDRYHNPNLLSDRDDFCLNTTTSIYNRSTAVHSREESDEPDQLKSGVNLIGYTRAEMGVGEGARSDAKSLSAANEPFGIICYTTDNPSRMSDLSWQHKEIDSAPYDITLLHINPDHALMAITELPSAYFDGHYVIGFWAWELPMIPKEWEAAFTHFDEIWVPSSFVQDAVAIKSPIPVIRIPHSIDVTSDTNIGRKDFGLPEEPYLFFSMFDTHSLQERKNPYGSINAFKLAFANDDMSVRLILKVNNGNAMAISSLQAAIGDYKNIILLDKVYSRIEINSLIANVDCFVSLHRSEGFGLGPAEAMALGKAVVATNWSGNSDYMRPDNSVCVSYELVEIEEDCGPYKKGQIWAEPDVNQAAQGMYRLATEKEFGPQLGKRAQETIKNEFSPAVVGELMRARLAQIRSFVTKY